jgi:peroxiredoxin
VLSNGDSLPPIPAKDLDGEEVNLTGLTAGSWSVVLFYRGHW